MASPCSVARAPRAEKRIASACTGHPRPNVVSAIIFEMTASSSPLFYPVSRRRRGPPLFRRFNLAWKMCVGARVHTCVTRLPRRYLYPVVDRMYGAQNVTNSCPNLSHVFFLPRAFQLFSLSALPTSDRPAPVCSPTFRGRWLFAPSQPALLSARTV